MTKYAWISGATIQHPIIRTHLLARIQDERGLSQAKKSLPYLALLGAKDTHNDATKMAAFIRKEFEQSEVHVFDDCGHSPFYEKPEETREAIFAFVSRVARKVRTEPMLLLLLSNTIVGLRIHLTVLIHVEQRMCFHCMHFHSLNCCHISTSRSPKKVVNANSKFPKVTHGS